MGTLLFVLILVAAYIVLGMITTRLLLPSMWSRAEVKEYNRSEFEGPAGYVAALSTVNFFFWPVATPINFLLGASNKMNPENLATQLKAKEKNEKRMQREINALEKSNNMELTQW